MCFNLNAQEENKNDLNPFHELLRDTLKMSPSERKELIEMIEKFYPKPSEKLCFAIDDFYRKVSKVEIYAYLDRNEWDENDYENYRYFSNFLNGKVDIKKKYIKNKVTLDIAQIESMKSILKKGNINNPYKCYDPRHLIVYYNSSNQIIGHIELCFDCNTSHSSKSVESFELCVFNLRPFFKEIGITYFEDAK
jgi:hypothetical protein